MNKLAADALRVLPRGGGYGMLMTLFMVIASSILGVLHDDGWSGLPGAILSTIAVLFYVGLPAIVLGFSVGLVATLFAFFVFTVLQHAGAATAASRWAAAIFAAIAIIWPSAYFLNILSLPPWSTASVVLSTAAGSAVLGQRLLKRLVAGYTDRTDDIITANTLLRADMRNDDDAASLDEARNRLQFLADTGYDLRHNPPS